MSRSKLIFAASLMALPACTTTSFAPPSVNSDQVMTNGSLTRDCRLTATNNGTIGEDVSGAISLVGNYHSSYQCWRRLAADGRQGFQIPAFISLIASTTAVAFGAGPNVAIAGSAGNSLFTAGNNYYAPAEQAEILNHGLDAITCIRSEATGTPAYAALPALGNEERRLQRVAGITDPTVEISSDRQYYNMVRSRLEAVDIVIAQRLMRRGTFDAAGVAAQIREAAKEVRDAQLAVVSPPAADQRVTGRFASSPTGTARLAQMVQLHLNLLQPKLDQCVLRAKT